MGKCCGWGSARGQCKYGFHINDKAGANKAPFYRGAGLTLILGKDTSPGIIIIPLILIGIGVGCIFQPTLVALQAHTPKSRRAVVISNRNFFRSAGGACGLAASAAVLQASLRTNLPSNYSYLAGKTYSLPTDLPPLDKPAVLDAYMAASRAVFILQIPLIGLCLLGSFFVKDRGLEYPEDAAAEQAVQISKPGAEKGGRAHDTAIRDTSEPSSSDRTPDMSDTDIDMQNTRHVKQEIP